MRILSQPPRSAGAFSFAFLSPLRRYGGRLGEGANGRASPPLLASPPGGQGNRIWAKISVIPSGVSEANEVEGPFLLGHRGTKR